MFMAAAIRQFDIKTDSILLTAEAELLKRLDSGKRGRVYPAALSGGKKLFLI